MKEQETEESTEVALLRRIDGKVDKVAEQLDGVGRRAVVAGGLSGSIAGSVVALGINYIKIKMGW